ncbi:MAG: DUF4398 domain-containing protein [Treponema sp.]|jgi:hypothetical protein|nr:DUF4398 domain-containing protein [Treponema sp.]
MKKISLGAVILLGLALNACTAPPVDDMNRARDAVIRAENDADAVAYAPNTLVRARDALVRMESEADAKRYDAAKNFAAEAISNAEKAIADGKTGLERAREEASRLINSLRDLLAETSAAINAVRENNMQLDFNALSRDLDTARRTYDEALQSFQANNFLDAIDKAQTVRSLLSSINVRMTETAQAESRKQ